MAQKEEDLIQKAVIEWLLYKHPRARELIIHIANQRATSPQLGYKLKLMGVKKGVSDLFLPMARGGYHGLFVELKTIDGTLTIEQKKFIKDMNEEGYCALATYGLDEAIRVINEYML